MECFAPIIFRLSPVALAALVGCSSGPATILESDIPNVSAMETIVTRDLKHEGTEIVGVTVLYRGEISDCKITAADTTASYSEYGWSLISEQARGASTVLNFGKGRRVVRIELSENQNDPMTSSAVLRVSRPTAASGAASSAANSSPVAANPPSGGSTGGIDTLEGFAPPVN
ncbi:MAG: hypothetical protein EXS15_06945 [Phycisphaerales bacterium]|nr:hypothetical protein [Phycisphaerales bacterium]